VDFHTSNIYSNQANDVSAHFLKTSH
jgi:hypothetical protein